MENNKHPADVLLHQLDSMLLPRPQLRAHEINDRDAEAVKLFGQAEVDVGEIDEDSDGGTALADGLAEAAELAVDAGQVEDDLGDAHDRHVLGADNAVETGLGHARATHAEELRCDPFWSEVLAEGVDEPRAIVLAAGLAGRDEDGWRHQGGLFWFCLHHSGRGWRANIAEGSSGIEKGKEFCIGDVELFCCLWP